MAERLNWIGLKFNKLTVLSEAGVNSSKNKIFNCLCDCGNTIIVISSKLKANTTKSCGCLRIANRIKHGFSKHPLYNIWSSMITRCTNLNAANYALYGGRGITVCMEWLNNIEVFIADVGERPSTSYSLERRNNNLGYFKDNCYWATTEEQNSNKRTNIQIIYNGETKTAMQWSKELGILHNRIYRNRNIEDSIASKRKRM